MYAEIFAPDLSSAEPKEFRAKNNSSPGKSQSRFEEFLEKSKLNSQSKKSLQDKYSERFRAAKDDGLAGSEKELNTLKEQLAEELELDNPEQAAELALFMLENELDLQEMLDFLNGTGISEQLLELSAADRAELSELLELGLNTEKKNTAKEADLRFLNSSALSSETLQLEDQNSGSKLAELLESSEEFKLEDFKDILNSAESGDVNSELKNLEAGLKELLADLSSENSSKLEEALTAENKEQNLVSKLLQNIKSSEQAEVGRADIVKEFSDGDLLSELREVLAAKSKKELIQAGRSENNLRSEKTAGESLLDRLFNTVQISSKAGVDLKSEAAALFETENKQGEADIFNGQSNLEYFNLNSESKAGFELAQGGGVNHLQSDLNIEDQILQTFKGEYSAEKNELTVELKPESLGKIDISLSYEGDKLVGKMFVENELIRASLEKSLNNLKTELVKEGINIEQFKIQTAANKPTQLEQQHQFAFDQHQGRFGDTESGQQQNYQQENAFRQRYFNQRNSANNYQSLDSSAGARELNYAWNQNALNLLA